MAKATRQKNINIKTFDIDVRSIDRSRKDIAAWRTAILSAESVIHPTRKLLYDLYADVLLDEHLTTVMRNRHLAILNSEVIYQRDGEEDPQVGKLIKTLFFRQLLCHILDAQFFGYTLANIDLTKLSGCRIVDRRHVVPSKHIVVKTPHDFDGVRYDEPPYSWGYLAVGDEYDLGLILKAVPLVLLKRGDISDWATFNEIFGMPLRKGKYDPMNPASKTQVETALREAGSAAWIVLPDGSEVEFISNSQTGQAANFDLFAARMDAGISKLFLGQTMTTEVGKSGSLAQAQIHENTQEDIAMADRQYVEIILNSDLKRILQAQGFLAENDSGEFQFVEEEADLAKDVRLNMDLLIHEKVAPLKRGYFAQEYNVEFDDSEPPTEANEKDDTPVDDATDQAGLADDGSTWQDQALRQYRRDVEALRTDFWLRLADTAKRALRFFEVAPRTSGQYPLGQRK